jgi:hypothetical protein
LLIFEVIASSTMVSAQQGFDDAVRKGHEFTVQVRVTGTRTDGGATPVFGSGAMLRDDGYIATANHVIGVPSEWIQSGGALQRTVEVRIPDAHGNLESNWRNAAVFQVSESLDFAILHVAGYGCKFARNTDPLRADFASKSDPLDCCVSILSCGPEWPGRVFGDGICGRDRRGSARVF